MLYSSAGFQQSEMTCPKKKLKEKLFKSDLQDINNMCQCSLKKKTKRYRKKEREKEIQGDPIHHCDIQVSPKIKQT